MHEELFTGTTARLPASLLIAESMNAMTIVEKLRAYDLADTIKWYKKRMEDSASRRGFWAWLFRRPKPKVEVSYADAYKAAKNDNAHLRHENKYAMSETAADALYKLGWDAVTAGCHEVTVDATSWNAVRIFMRGDPPRLDKAIRTGGLEVEKMIDKYIQGSDYEEEENDGESGTGDSEPDAGRTDEGEGEDRRPADREGEGAPGETASPGDVGPA